jgi:hypothetical protein
VGHSDGKTIELADGSIVNGKGLAKRLLSDSSNYRGGSVRLFACEAGCGKNSFAQQLADGIQDVVEAPTRDVFIHGDGFFYHEGTGRMRFFFPRKKR